MPVPWLAPLLREDAPPGPPGTSAGRFDGLYGPLYDRAIQSDAMRRLAPLAYGDAGPVTDLDGFAARVAGGTSSTGRRRPVLLDVPCGGGTLLPRLARAGYTGRVIECDLAEAMLGRARRMAGRGTLPVALLRADAQDLPLREGAVDGAVSLNGLHCIPDPGAFLRELARVVRPGGRLWLITLVGGGTRRGDAVIRAGRLAGILPGPPPPRGTLLGLLAQAGFGEIEQLGGASLVGLAAQRTP